MFTTRTILVWPLTFGLGLAAVQRAAAEVPLDVTDRCVASTPDPPTAYELFEQGAAQYKEGNYDAASQKLTESFCLRPMARTLRLLANCKEKQSKFASAYSDYIAAAELARVTRQTDVEKNANQRANRIASLRSYLTIRVETSVPDLEIQRNGTHIGVTQLGNRMPIDPGVYVVTARAAGYAPFEQRVTIGANAEEQTLAIPALQPLPPPPPAIAATPQAPRPPPTRGAVENTNSSATSTQAQAWPWVLGGVGVAAVVLGGVSGVLALRDKNKMDDACRAQSPCSDPHALSIQSRRDFEWTMARVSLPIGLAAIAGAATWLTLSSSAREQPKLAAATLKALDTSVNEHGGTLWVRGSF